MWWYWSIPCFQKLTTRIGQPRCEAIIETIDDSNVKTFRFRTAVSSTGLKNGLYVLLFYVWHVVVHEIMLEEVSMYGHFRSKYHYSNYSWCFGQISSRIASILDSQTSLSRIRSIHLPLSSWALVILEMLIENYCCL